MSQATLNQVSSLVDDTKLCDIYDNPIELAKCYIDRFYNESICLDDLANLSQMNRFRFAKQFRAYVGVSPYQYVCRVRVLAAQKLIRKGAKPAHVAGEVGFFDQSHLAKHFKKLCGVTPRQYRDEHFKQ
ncbi:helix-turn-helix transcriptional regulator [Marinomonas balearica]|uniref:AraC-like DNA-binding protein n=1 Tax=Marinomonas balearica TaxID=491947 RepID=A0A4R6M238_9GAMM|nr:AraC family transcriptional regulator [Marinomonas balearica]TDO95301.1 AraC-like DNA-binding protein [Marinomonas balearica]